MLRVRGDVHEDIEWTLGRVPAITEQLCLNNEWYRITNVVWKVETQVNPGAPVGYDVGIVVCRANKDARLLAQEAERGQ